MADRYELRFSGSGGQGMILAGIIMAEAAPWMNLSRISVSTFFAIDLAKDDPDSSIDFVNDLSADFWVADIRLSSSRA